ncbi:MAG: hypothetical protein R3B70_22955 [Polyangiaceae bacterium]
MNPSFRAQSSQISDARTAPSSLRRWGAALAGGLLAAALLLAPESASAQTKSPVTGDVKGIVGGALLGAEVVDLTIGIVGVEAGWPYLVFGALGAAGGGVGGYFVEQETRDAPEVPLYMLAGGMALVIPTIVVSLNATMYKPPEGASTTTFEPADNQPSTSPSTVQPPMPSPTVAPTQSRRPSVRAERGRRMSFSLVGLHEGSLALSVPAVQVKPLYTEREMWTYGVGQGTEVRVPVFQASF